MPQARCARVRFGMREMEATNCNLCGANDTELCFQSRDDRFEVDDEIWNAVKCRECGLGYLNPRPTPANIGDYYPTRFYAGRSPTDQARRYALQSRYIEDLPPGRLLDIGCANGDWLATIVPAGWQVQGLEPSPNRQHSHGVPILDSTFPDANLLEPGSFDVITAWAVFEHLFDPMAAFQRASELLKPGGRLIVLVTNTRSVGFQIGHFEDVPRHLYFFSEATLRGYSEKARLELVRVEQSTDLFGGSGRGSLRVRTFEALGLGRRGYHRWLNFNRMERFRKRPDVAALFAGIGLLERVVLNDWLTRKLRLSSVIIGIFRKSAPLSV